MIQIKKIGKQKTLAREVTLQGINPFKPSQTVTMKVKPSTGYIKFHFNRYVVPVNYLHLQNTNDEHTTNIGNDKVIIKSVEHFLSAISGLGIDAYEVYLKGGDCLPFFDASAENYYKLLHKAGIKNTQEDCQMAIVTETIFFSDNKGSLAILQPADHFSISALIQFPEPVGEQYYSFDPQKEQYFQIAKARSFIRASCDENYWEMARTKIPVLPKKIEKSPLIVFKDGQWIIPPREPLECVKHKILDAMGDLVILGLPIQAKITLIRPGHEFNRKLVSYLGNLINQKL